MPSDMRDIAQEAVNLYQNQRYDEAAAKYQSIIDKHPDSFFAWSNLGVDRLQQGDLGDAEDALQEAVKLSPDDVLSLENLGIVYYQLKRYDDALQNLEHAVAINPKDSKAHNFLGMACSQKKWPEVAEKEFLKAIQTDDTYADAHFNLALVYATEQPPSLQLARHQYHRAVELGIPRDTNLEVRLQISPPKEAFPALISSASAVTGGSNELDQLKNTLSADGLNFIQRYNILPQYRTVDIQVDPALWDHFNHDQQLRICNMIADSDFLQKMSLLNAHLYVDSTEIGLISPNMWGGGNKFVPNDRYWGVR